MERGWHGRIKLRKTLTHKVRSRKPLSNLVHKVNPNQNTNKRWSFRVSVCVNFPRPSHGDTLTLFELAGLEPTFTLGHSSSRNDSTNLDTCKKQTSTWQKPKIGFVQFGSRVE